MIDKRKALEPVLDKVGKLFAMLSSDNPNESASALTKMREILKTADLDIHDLWTLMTEKQDKLAALLAAMFADDKDLLIKIGTERTSYFVNDAVYADVEVRGHRNSLPIHSKAYQEWLLQQFFLDKGKAPTSGAIKSAVATLAAIVKYGPDLPTHIDVQLRTADVDGRIYIDLGNEQRQCVEVDDNGWRVVATPASVRFRRTDGMKALPLPLAGGSVDMLRQFVNLSDGDFILFIAVLLDAFRSGKHPILNLVGEFATAKSTLAKIFKQLVDPDETDLRSLPGTTRDIFVAVQNARVRAWDNVSKIEQTISDALCQLSDGSGFGTRKLYTDGDEFRVQGSRSIILTGLNNCATRPDLNSRTVMLSLQPIKDEARKSETDFWTRFNEAAPLILGALLDALVHGLKTLPTIKLDKLDRLADFQLFGHAVEGAYP